MKNPICFHVTNTAMIGMARLLLVSQDGSGASGPRILLTRPPSLKRNSHTATRATLAVTKGM